MPNQRRESIRKRPVAQIDNTVKVSSKQPKKNKVKKCSGGSKTSFSKLGKPPYSLEFCMEYLFKPTCPSSLGIARIFFGFLMLIDIPDERGLAELDMRYGDPMKCHFPLFNWMAPLPLEYMGILYFFMLMGAAGITLGYKFHLSCLMFTIPYWYIFLLDKTTWNNHSYLFGLLSILFTFSSAHHTFSLDSRVDPTIRNKPVPLWNYAIIRFQFFLLYFYAGIKKFDSDWLHGHSMTRLSMHWVFDPFRLVLTDEQIDLWIIHIFGFVFDLTVGFFLLIDKTRPVAILFSSAFHLMNSRMFYIGQFPYVCLCLTPIFCSYDWPERLWNALSLKKSLSGKDELRHGFSEAEKTGTYPLTWNQKITFYFLFTYAGIQAFLPYSHFITKGYNNWTNGLYGYSWDMMVHNWDSVLTVIKVVDNDSGEEFFLDPEAWVENSRFTKYGDMLIQYAQCVKRNLPNLSGIETKSKHKFQNISIYADVWCSLNGRFQQRMFDPRQDLLVAKWSPFKEFDWLMPVISELTPWREKMDEMENEVIKRSNDSGLLFVADFPGLRLDNFIHSELSNVSISVLQGTVVLEKNLQNKSRGAGLTNNTLNQGESDTVISGEFHTVYTVSKQPSCYMYSYVNRTLSHMNVSESYTSSLKEGDSIIKSLKFRLANILDSVVILRNCFNKFLYNKPIPIRSH